MSDTEEKPKEEETKQEVEKEETKQEDTPAEEPKTPEKEDKEEEPKKTNSEPQVVQKKEDNNNSPSPNRPLKIGHYAAHTKGSQSASPGRAVVEVGAPRAVADLSSLSPKERIKREWSNAREQREKSAKRPGGNFARGASREGLLGKGNLVVKTERPDFKTQQAKRAWENQLAKQERLEKMANYNHPEHVAYSADKFEEQEPFKVKKEKKSGLWTKSTEDRFQFNYSWTQFPQATPQSSLMHRAPGPGSYGGSTSHVKHQ